MAVLDYSLVLDRAGGTAIDAVLVEEFVRAPDASTLGLHGLTFARGDRAWRGAAAFSRNLRTDPALLARVTPTDRAGAADAYRTLDGGRDLPGETALRALFADYEPFATAPPLDLGPARPPDGFRERRHYRVLFAKNLTAPVGPGERTIDGDHFSWTLRRVGRGIAWALDVSVLLASGTDHTIGPVLHALTADARHRGLIPVTTERFA